MVSNPRRTLGPSSVLRQIRRSAPRRLASLFTLKGRVHHAKVPTPVTYMMPRSWYSATIHPQGRALASPGNTENVVSRVASDSNGSASGHVTSIATLQNTGT